jgi:hypothetical protein
MGKQQTASSEDRVVFISGCLLFAVCSLEIFNAE